MQTSPVLAVKASRVNRAKKKRGTTLGLLLLLIVAAAVCCGIYWWLAGDTIVWTRAIQSADSANHLHARSTRVMGLVQLIGGAVVFILTGLLINGTGLPNIICRLVRRPNLMMVPFGLGAIVALWFGLVLRGQAFIEDDLTYFFQAKLFERGHLYLDNSVLGMARSAFYWFWTTSNNLGLFSYQIPGHSAFLMVAHKLGSFALLSIVESIITCYLTMQVALQFYGRRTAAVTALLLLSSPYVLTTFSGYSVSTTTACMVSVTLWCFARCWKSPNLLRFLAIGVAMGILVWIRPSTALFIAPAMFLLVFRRMMGGEFSAWWPLFAALVTLLFTCGYVGYCSYLSGHFSVSPGDVYSNRMKSPEMSLGNLLESKNQHPVGWRSGVVSLVRLNFYLHGWPLSLSLPILGMLLARRRAVTWMLTCSCVLMFVFYFFKRSILAWYYFELIPLLVILSAHGIVQARLWLARRVGGWHRWDQHYWRWITAGMLTAMSVGIPTALVHQRQMSDCFVAAHKFVHRHTGNRPTLVLLDSQVHGALRRVLLTYNDPFLDNPLIYASIADGYSDSVHLAHCFSGREVLLLRPNNQADQPFKLISANLR